MQLKKKKKAFKVYSFLREKRKLISEKEGKFQEIVLDSTRPEKKVFFQDLFFLDSVEGNMPLKSL